MAWLSVLAPARLMVSQLLALRGLGAWFLIFGSAPSLLVHLTADDTQMTRVAWGFAIYFALMWALAIHALVRPERVSGWLIARVVVGEALGGTALAVVLERAIDPDMTKVAWTVLGVGLPETIAKSAPIALFMFLRRKAWTIRMYIFAGAVSGLTFGVIEAVAYSDLYHEFSGYGSSVALTTYTMWRLLADGLFHACAAGVVSFFIGVAYWRRNKSWQLITIGVAVVSVLHGVYDRWSDTWVGALTAVAIVMLFVGYIRIGDVVALRVSRDGLESVGEVS